jgi:hypothetical protein
MAEPKFKVGDMVAIRSQLKALEYDDDWDRHVAVVTITEVQRQTCMAGIEQFNYVGRGVFSKSVPSTPFSFNEMELCELPPVPVKDKK